MPPHKYVYMIVGIICIAFALIGALMYPLNTLHIFWIILYEVTICFSVVGILLLIQREGFGEENSD